MPKVCCIEVTGSHLNLPVDLLFLPVHSQHYQQHRPQPRTIWTPLTSKLYDHRYLLATSLAVTYILYRLARITLFTYRVCATNISTSRTSPGTGSGEILSTSALASIPH